MNHHELRRSFLDFFGQRTHKIVSSSPVIPFEDPTLMFTNAGMNQFKEVLAGNETRSYNRAVSVQKCIRVSGKHNDFEIVGYDGFHHTFFEMLGNWSFGDYYKKEAIEYAWEFLTKVLKFPESRLAVSIYKDDEESYRLWREMIRIPENRIFRLGDIKAGNEENFWSMGETGPCGFCTEIYHQLRTDRSTDIDKDFLELWNLVFMEFYRDASGRLSPLRNKNVDTGMGLERLYTVLNNKTSNYQTDLFSPMIAQLEQISKKQYEKNQASFQVVVDHIRALTFAIADGGHFSNEGRGYVLRKILRRASRHLKKLDVEEPVLHTLVDTVVSSMNDFYPELKEKQGNIKKFIRMEEERFLKTLDKGLEKLRIVVEKLGREGKNLMPGRDVFELYDTYGFPMDITKEMAREKDLMIDEKGFQELMLEQKERGRQSWEGNKKMIDEEKLLRTTKDIPATEFLGYETMEAESIITGILLDNALIKNYDKKENIILILRNTPFYAESGGQAGDKGKIYNPEFEFEVFDTQKAGNHFLHLGRLNFGEIRVLEKVVASVDRRLRLSTMRNHTATHLLQAALRQTVGSHIVQAGSSVSPERLRFDFRHYEALSSDQITQTEKLINQKIQENLKVEKFVMDKEEAVRSGATAIFGEKYGEKVRVVKIDDFSRELCGGTHLDQTGTIGLFLILSESSIASGIRRIEAITGEGAFDHVQSTRKILRNISEIAKTQPEKLEQRLQDLIKKSKESGKNIKPFPGPAEDMERIIKNAKKKNGSHVIIHEFDSLDSKLFNSMGDQIRTKVPSGIILLINSNKEEDKFSLLLLLTDDLVKKGMQANRIIQEISKIARGTGGGRADRASGGGKNITLIPEIRDQSQELLLNSL